MSGLSPGREARLRLAVYDAFDARGGDSDEFGHRCGSVVDLHRRLHAEQLAELGYLPDTIEGCVATLNVAAAILAAVAGTPDVDQPQHARTARKGRSA